MPPPHQAWDGTQWRHDAAVLDDQALVINVRGRGLVVVTGCGHAGVVNIARQALRLTGVDRLHALIGGFHLSGPAFEPIIEPTVAALTELAPALIVPGHCTGWRAQHALARALPEAWVQPSVGSRYQLERGLTVTAYDAVGWGGFGTTAATAAATLTGLLFIAVSINSKEILDNAPLPGRAAQTLIFFAFPMIVALLLVVPAQARGALGVELIATGIFAWATAVVIDHRAGRTPIRARLVAPADPDRADGGQRRLRHRGRHQRGGRAGGRPDWLAPATVLAILAGLVNTWVLLVEIMR